MLKLHQLFLRRFILFFLTLFFVLGLVFYFFIKNFYIEQTKQDLKKNIDILSYQMLLDKDLDSDKFAKKIKELTQYRVTIVNFDGKVIGESDENKDVMENHKDRYEIHESNYEPYGSIIRHSHTIDKDLLYLAKKIKLHNKYIYIRMAKEISKINEEFFYLSLQAGLLFIVFLMLMIWIVLKLSQQVELQTNKILYFLNNLIEQKKPFTITSDYSSEFNQITKLLSEVSFKLAKRNKQKAKYTVKLKVSNRQKDDIISAISHEFKNPIAVISGYAQTLIEDKDINNNIRDKFLSKIASNSARLTTMIDRLRLAIKLDEGKKQHTFTQVNLHTTIVEIIENLKAKYKDRDIVVECDGNVKISADEILLNIAITNLVENALKYSEDEIKIECNDKFISVSDFGVGLSEQDITKITDKFYRVSKNHWDNSLGLGLSIVKNITTLHNFQLEITSVEHEGSIFKIIFHS